MAIAIMEKTKPILNDTSIIKKIYEGAPGTDRLIFVAAIIKLYSPATFSKAGIYTSKGVCSELALCFGYNDISSVSKLIAQARAYMAIKSFRDGVDVFSREVAKINSV